MLRRCIWLRSAVSLALPFFKPPARPIASLNVKTVETGWPVNITPDDFVERLKTSGKRRAYIAYDESSGQLMTSNDIALRPFADHFAADAINYHRHECVFLEVGRRSGALMGGFVWRTNRGQACGGIRMWKYKTMQEYLEDGLRLSRGMGHKSALAGLWAGGGKGVINAPDNHKDPATRRDVFLDYGEFLSSLNGCYVGAEDVGLTVSDLDYVHEKTRFVTCVSPQLGGSGNPSIATGIGVVRAMEASIDFKQMGSLKGKTVAIQGAGNVAVVIMNELLKHDVHRVIATDCDLDKVDAAKRQFQNAPQIDIHKVDIGDNSILQEKCDVISPCALGGVLNEQTIPLIAAPIVCGAANNQLATPSDSERLRDRGITYVVDFVANRMGIVNCANEAYGRIPGCDPIFDQHLGREWENSIYQVVQRILRESRDQKTNPTEAAERLANIESLRVNPMFPHRSQQIIRHLIRSSWDFE